jgi:hypothetical protein
MSWLPDLSDSLHGVRPLVSDGVSPETFRYVVGVFVAAFGASLGIIRQMYEKRITQLEQENAEKQKRLDAYGSLAPDIVTEVRAMLNEKPTPPISPGSPPSSPLPYPYGTSRRSRHPRRGTGGTP